MSNAFVFALTEPGFETAQSIATLLGTKASGLAARIPGGDIDDLDDALAQAFRAGRPIVGVTAAGILIRKLGPLLQDKRDDPPVVAVSEDGAFVVPLIGGHHGANALADRLAVALDGTAAVTTAGDHRFGVALDDPPEGWKLANPEDAKGVMAGLLAGETINIDSRLDWLLESALPVGTEGEYHALASAEHHPGDENRLTFHPQTLCLGVGCERDAPLDDLLETVSRALDGLSPISLAGIFSIDVKIDEAAILALATHLGVPLRFFDADRLEQETPRLATPSDIVFQEVGCHGVAEGAALAAAGPDGHLIRPKVKGQRSTAAIAEAPHPMVAAEVPGKRRGHLAVVGIGPGQAGWRTPEADRLVSGATDLVGYGLYLDLLGSAAEGKARHGYELGQEIDRCRQALDLAAEGRNVALICSGDAGIYAMAALVFEVLERDAKPDWKAVDIEITPGISALQAAAARAGAPLGHDFCTISLSDLLTPWEVIEKRIRAAAVGDFVVSFYNPVSKRRRTQLAEARRILLEHRPAETPVVIARELGRPDEAITLTTLRDLDPETIDMLTLVMVGSSTSRRFGERVYTPRGYEAKDRMGKAREGGASS
ncbi:MAG: precorrin-3B C(17)-methyltransferase [Magnetovibrionaceae bacterium]